MEKIENGFWDYVERWRKDFPDERKMRWENNWLENDYCAVCHFCCGPQDSSLPFPMGLLPRQCSPDAVKNFHLLDSYTACLLDSGCKSDSSHGCTLTLEEKPLACGLFPIVLANGGLWLYQHCPAVVFTPLIRFLDIARKVAALLNELTLEDLRHISLWFTAEKLASSYIDLRITIFDATGKKLILK